MPQAWRAESKRELALPARQLLEEADAEVPVRMKDSTARPRVTDRYNPITAQRLGFRLKALGV
jgi:hypothetical protein